jgi:hypothetical protein
MCAWPSAVSFPTNQRKLPLPILRKRSRSGKISDEKKAIKVIKAIFVMLVFPVVMLSEASLISDKV